MHRLNPLLMLSWLTLSLVPGPARGESADAEDTEFLAELEFLHETDEVESASRYRQSIFWSPSAVTIFTRDYIRASGATSLVDLLRRVPGFNVFRVKSSYSLMGTRALTDKNNNQVLLLVDGREELIELTGFALWNALSIDLFEIERIEVIRGPGSALYGANAFAAVVSITTISDPLPHEAGVSLTGGEVGSSNLFARYRGRLELGGGRLSYGLGAGTESALSPSVPRESLLSIQRVHAFLRFRQEKRLDLSLQTGMVMGDSLAYLFAGDAQAQDMFLPWVLVKSDFFLGQDTSLRAQLFYNRYKLDVDFRTGINALGLWIADIPVIGWDSHTLDGEVQLDHLLSETLHLIAGGNLRYSLLGGKHLIPESDDEWRAAGFAHLEWRPWQSFQFAGGFRLDAKNFSDVTFSPRLTAVYRPWPEQAFRLGYGLAFRKPSYLESRLHLEVVDYNQTFREIVDVMAKQIGNDQVTNTKVHSIEIGWQARWLEERLRVSVNLFYNFYFDIISILSDLPERPDFPGVPDIANSEISFTNVDEEITAFGGEAEVAFDFNKTLTAWGHLALRRLDSDDDDWHTASEPQLRAALGGSYRPESGFRVDLSLHYVGTYKSWRLPPTSSLWHYQVKMDDEFLVFGRMGYRFRPDPDRFLEIGLVVQSPLGNPYREFGGRSNEYFGWADVEGESDFGGEYLVRIVSLYLNGTF